MSIELKNMNDDFIPLKEGVEKPSAPTLRVYCPLLFNLPRLWLIVLFVISGAIQPLLLEVIHYNGALKKETLLATYPTYLAEVFTILVAWKNRYNGKIPWKLVIWATLLDCISNGLNFTGLLLAGSATMTVIYSFVIVYLAVLSRVILRRKLTAGQWVGCFLVTGGIAVTALNAQTEGPNVFAGVICVLIGSFSHAGTFILNETIMTRQKDPIPPELLSTLMGIGGCILFGLYEAIYVLPRFDELVIDSIKKENGSVSIILLCFAGQLISCLVHAVTYYRLIAFMGSVTSGICKGLIAVAIIAFSAVVFCHNEESQCLNAVKGMAFTIVVVGVMTYSFSAPKKETKVIAAGQEEDRA